MTSIAATKMTSRTTNQPYSLVLVVGEEPASKQIANLLAPEIQVKTCHSSRGVRRHLTHHTLVVAANLEALGDGDSTLELVTTLMEIAELGADLAVDGKLKTKGEIRGMVSFIDASRSIRRARVLAGKRHSSAKDGRPRLRVDLPRIQRLRSAGASLREAAESCGVSVSTIRRRLIDAA